MGADHEDHDGTHEAFDRAGDGGGPVVVSCEHASRRLPAGWWMSPHDRPLFDTHWAWDIGAAALARELAHAAGAVAVLSRFSRLLVDANRPIDDETLVRREAEGRVVELNRDVSEADLRRRIAEYWEPYHEALDEAVGGSSAPVVFSVHTFTPSWQGRRRRLEAGVLFDRDVALADRVRRALVDAGLDVRMNEPYSGREGLIYSVDRHARAHGRAAVELELRQDLAVRPGVRARVVHALVGVLVKES